MQPNPPGPRASNVLGSAWLPPLLKQADALHANLGAGQGFTALFAACLTPEYPRDAMPRTGAVIAINAALSWTIRSYDEAAIIHLSR